MDEATAAALTLTWSSTPKERAVDITTTGAKSGEPRRIEIWFRQVDDRWYLTSVPGARGWYANLLANPKFIFHLKNGITRDLAATAVPIVDPAVRLRVLTDVTGDMNQPSNPGHIKEPMNLEDWLASSALVEVIFES
ncbi:MAG: hypothetical protein JWO10_1199 [Microbacteriaceae bacterium]|nr:hypothetical protein [Microbacteriaceae bacterium]